MKQLLDAGAVGKVLTFTHHCGQYLPDWHPWEDYRTFYVSRKETGACREIVPFELTWLNWLIGDAAHVTGMRAKLSQLDTDIDDAYHLLLRYQGGALGHLLVEVLARSPVRACRIIGETGTLEWIAGDRRLRHYQAESGEWSVHEEPAPDAVEGYSDMSAESMYIDEMKAFVTAIAGHGPYPHTYADDLKLLRILHAAEEGADRGAHVSV